MEDSTLICQEDIHLVFADEKKHEPSGHTTDSCLTEAHEAHDDVELLVSQNCSFRLPPKADVELLVSQNCSFSLPPKADVELLVSQNCSFSLPPKANEWLSCAREESVRWILRMKDNFSFGAQTTYLAVSYYDRFLERRSIYEGKEWALRLLSTACLLLAAKMEELSPPGLYEFQTEGYGFDKASVRRMELLVLNTLEWRMRFVTPFDYLEQFASKLQIDDELEGLSEIATKFIFAIIRVMNLVDCHASTIAVAAILAASGQVITKKIVETKISAISLPEPLEADQVFTCYNVMIEAQDKLGAMKASDSSEIS